MKRLDGTAGALWIATVIVSMALMGVGTALGGTGDQASKKPSVDQGGKSPAVQGFHLELERLEERRQAALAGLKLSEEQLRRLNEMFDAQRAKVTEIIRQNAEASAKNPRIEELNNEMKDARLHHDDKRVHQIARELTAIDPAAATTHKAMLGFDKDVARALGGKQEVAYKRMAARLHRKWRPNVRAVSFSIVLRNLSELDVSKEQHTKVLAALRELSPGLASASRARDYTQMHKIEDEFRKRVLDILTEKQRARYLELDRQQAAERDSSVGP